MILLPIYVLTPNFVVDFKTQILKFEANTYRERETARVRERETVRAIRENENKSQNLTRPLDCLRVERWRGK